jgi:hypothetical protein
MLRSSRLLTTDALDGTTKILNGADGRRSMVVVAVVVSRFQTDGGSHPLLRPRISLLGGGDTGSAKSMNVTAEPPPPLL